MSKPQSIKIDPWTDWPKQPYFSLFTEDFVQDKLYTLKVNSKGDKSTINVKASVNNDKTGLSISDQVKLWFDLPAGRSAYAKVKSSNYIKLQYDNGIIDKWDSQWNLYGAINTNKSLENISLRLGADSKSQHCHSANKLRVDFNADHNKTYTWYNRTVVKHKDFTFGSLAVYGITQNLLVKNNLLFGYKIQNDASAILRVENNGFRKGTFDWANFKGYFDTVKLDLVNKYNNNTTYGLEGVFSLTGKTPFEEAVVAVQHYHEEKKVTVKAKVSSKFDLTLAVKYPSLLFKDIATATWGFQGSNLHNDKRTFKVGVQVQCNV